MSRKELWDSAFPGIVLMACTLMAGCTRSHAPVEAKPAQAAAGLRATSGPADHVVELKTSDVEEEPDEILSQHPFTPPFPNRRELFVPPQRPIDVPASDQLGPRVELRGFVNFDGLKALLWVDGVVVPVEEGGSRAEVQVISINPPRVTLQRGAHRWTESLFAPP